MLDSAPVPPQQQTACSCCYVPFKSPQHYFSECGNSEFGCEARFCGHCDGVCPKCEGNPEIDYIDEQDVISEQVPSKLCNHSTFDTNCTYCFAEIEEKVVCYKDKDSRYRYVSRKFCELMGMKREQLLGRTSTELFPESVEATSTDRQVWIDGKPLTSKVSVRVNGVPMVLLTRRIPQKNGLILCITVRAKHILLHEKKAPQSKTASYSQYLTQ